MTDFNELNRRLLSLSLPIARYQFNFTVTSPIFLSEYAGSAIRGSFGHTLRRVSCMTHERECDNCPLIKSCPYKVVFEPPVPQGEQIQEFNHIPVSFLIEAPLDGVRAYKTGSRLSFSMVLCGKSLNHLALIIFAMIKAMNHDIGHGRAVLDSVDFINQKGMRQRVYDENSSEVQDHDAVFRPVDLAGINKVSLSFQTPLRIQTNGEILGPDELTAQKLLITLIRRCDLVLRFHCKTLLDLPFSEIKDDLQRVMIKSDLIWRNWVRYSNRQKHRMNLGGYVGTIDLENLPDYTLPILQLGEYLHVGKNAVFGLGGYKLTIC